MNPVMAKETNGQKVDVGVVSSLRSELAVMKMIGLPLVAAPTQTERTPSHTAGLEAWFRHGPSRCDLLGRVVKNEQNAVHGRCGLGPNELGLAEEVAHLGAEFERPMEPLGIRSRGHKKDS